MLVNSAGFGKEVTYLLRTLAVPRLGEAMLRRPTRLGLRHAERALYHDKTLADRDRVALSLEVGRRPEVAAFMAELLPTLGTLRGVLPGWRADLLREASRQKHPMLIVWGDKDQILPAHHFEEARKAFPHAKSHMFRTTGHLPQVERPEAFANLVRDFLTTSEARTA